VDHLERVATGDWGLNKKMAVPAFNRASVSAAYGKGGQPQLK
jgi:hypothetical protein